VARSAQQEAPVELHPGKLPYGLIRGFLSFSKSKKADCEGCFPGFYVRFNHSYSFDVLKS